MELARHLKTFIRRHRAMRPDTQKIGWRPVGV
jgi:hypothetical protein